MFVGKANNQTRVEHLKGASLGYAPASPANITLGWKSLAETNTILLRKSIKYGCKKVYMSGPCVAKYNTLNWIKISF